ncbi:predicted protein [Pyrenophora tritici-repentis Pt-1C-BFP]|uniref:Uncharacterized protein n=1 Tax=Pyrenophora tritici-repentis (strain Pt-1C-BFP) TaxID=426418 RepID=B2WDB8_PYRTR|nr:uncharacterized protein PTRG_07977 [Pyrenophora tritici-repentis Pt-1C-BFP]EDU50896.1 predicted protein [Pyrenophora tritici-repentis Pt-1C-BFP]
MTESWQLVAFAEVGTIDVAVTSFHLAVNNRNRPTLHHAVLLLPPAFCDRYINLVSMDIQKWLDETVQPDAPPGSSKRKVSRKRSRSDSSLIDPHPPSPCPQQVDSDGGTNEALHATLSNCSTDSRYARKPRRKTRPEHYEPGAHAPPLQKGKSKKTRRKKSKALPGMVQNFQANNFSGDRLTLKPRELGLFNKGRTSTAVKGRGLPDLVFSEMKFLQQEKVQSEANHRPGVAKKKRKKDHAQTKEEEISAFFNSIRPELTGRDGNTRPVHAAVFNDKRRTRNQHSVINTTIPTVELTNKGSYLGFGSRGPRHGSTSYVSWSDSNHVPSTTPARLPVEADTFHGQRDSELQRRYRPMKSAEKDQFKRPAPPTARMESKDHAAGRFRVSSSSPRRLNLVDRSARFESSDIACSPSSMPPSMPHASVDVRPARPGKSPRNARQEVTANADEHLPTDNQNHGPSDYENDDAQYRQHRPHLYMDEDMYHNSYAIQLGYSDNNQGRHNEDDWEGLFEEPISYELEEGPEILDGEEEFPAPIGRGHPSDPRPENDVVAPGFWRPNKLY